MKKVVYIFMLILVMFSCKKHENVLNIYTWSEFIPEENNNRIWKKREYKGKY